MPRKLDPTEVLDRWTERDLTEAARAGLLPPAFSVEEVVDRLGELLDTGRRPIITGEAGVGKTAAVYELVRRSVAGRGPRVLAGRRILQVSLRRQASMLKAPYQLGKELHDLTEAMLKLPDDLAIYIRDLPVAYHLDVEPQLVALDYRLDRPVLAEGSRSVVEAMFETYPELAHGFSVLDMDEPDLDCCGELLRRWNQWRRECGEAHFAEPALEEALFLSHRFLARSRLPRKVLDVLARIDRPASPGRPVEAGEVIRLFCRQHQVPPVLVDPEQSLDLAELERRFGERVLGQPQAVRAVVSMIGLVKAGLSDVRRPFGVFLFVGPTGVGKTHIAQMLAEYLFGNRGRLIRFNMADHPQEGDAAVLFGNPEAMATGQRRGLLHQRLLGHPFVVVLLDEFEKAHPKVHDRFLQLFDEGEFINGAGETVSCRSSIIIATSNAGAEMLRGGPFGFARTMDRPTMDRSLASALQERFRFEFLNRFDHIVHFYPLGREEIRTIARREIEQLLGRAGVRQRELTVEIDEAVLDWLAVHGYDPDYGARLLRRVLERHVTTALADTIVRDRPAPGSRVLLCVRRNAVVARVIDERAEPRRARERVELPVGTGRQTQRLDEPALRGEAARLLAAAGPRLEELERKRQILSELVARMNEPGFWDSHEARRETLDELRSLDVAVQAEGRLAGPIRRVQEMVAGPAESVTNLRRLAGAVEQAGRALQEWQRLAAEEGPASVWLLISSADPLRPAGKWLSTLAEMEQRWCRSVRLAAHPVAAVGEAEQLDRLVLLVEGPGAHGYLEMEQGIHRLRRRQARDVRASIELLPCSVGSTGPARNPVETTATARRPGPLGLVLQHAGRVALPDRGLVVEFRAADATILGLLLADLRSAWGSAPSEAPPIARVYGEEGIGARDPRTDVKIARLNDALRGRLDPFLDGWRALEAQSNQAASAVTSD